MHCVNLVQAIAACSSLTMLQLKDGTDPQVDEADPRVMTTLLRTLHPLSALCCTCGKHICVRAASSASISTCKQCGLLPHLTSAGLIAIHSDQGFGATSWEPLAALQQLKVLNLYHVHRAKDEEAAAHMLRLRVGTVRRGVRDRWARLDQHIS